MLSLHDTTASRLGYRELLGSVTISIFMMDTVHCRLVHAPDTAGRLEMLCSGGCKGPFPALGE